MKRTPVLLVALAVLSAGAGQGALAASSKAPKTLKKTYYLHGTSQLGNQDYGLAGGEMMPMNATKPSGASDKTFVTYGAVASPNPACAGSPFFANWTGSVSGKLKGTATVKFYAQSTGGTAKVQLFADVTESLCNEAYPGALGELEVALPASPTPQLVTATFPVSSRTKISSVLTLQIQAGAGPQVSAFTYDSTVSPASLTFTCVPKTGKKTC